MSGQAPTNGVPPPIQLWTPAVDFVENRMWQYHPAYNAQNHRYDPIQAQFVALEAGLSASSSNLLATNVPAYSQPRPAPGNVHDMDLWAVVFPGAMSELNTTPAPKQGDLQKWGIRTCSDWPEVQRKLEMARRDYDHLHGQKHVGKFRRKMRDVMDKSSIPLQQIVKGVPSVDAASPIVSVANVLLDAYRQAVEVREAVTTGFDDLPTFFASADFFLSNYPDDENIQRSSVAFVLSVFKTIEEAILFYTSKQVKRAGFAIFTGEQYQQNLTRALGEMKVSAEAFVSQATMSLHHRVTSASEQSRTSHAATKQDNWLSHQALGAILQEERVGRSERAWLGNLLNTTLYLLAEKERMYSDAIQLSRSQTNISNDNWRPRSPLPSRSGTPMAIERQSWTPRDLWLRVGIPNIDETDLQRVLNRAADIDFSDRGRAQQMITTQHFRHWMLSQTSAKLLVHGDFENASRTSPFSVLAATVTQGFRSSPSIINLVFFCGQHLLDDEHHGGNAMIRSLIAQLLRQYPFSTIVPLPDMLIGDIDAGNVKQLCTLFTYLIQQLSPQTTVFCLIDSINEYEREEYIHGMDDVVFALLGLADRSSRASFKLLLLSPRPTVEVRRAFDGEDGILLHMQQLPVIEDVVGPVQLQEMVGMGFEGTDRAG
ncbi:hypothetical protein HBI48_130480 [Parastagonospora nodorum]|nr:hypothetical protein HBI48_130480 [Parastagonospora nodorum]KAH6438827.1 hypothetical protein HBI59_154300 [Parastagonospora nodorum]